ncbi:hypothetical protein [Shouchella shacheensis]|uniref:hypothetical protein n=1 Tax=Shouchella shacheensis TaxID=1649580 RepID=UPI00073FB986|nr:hypothetical protein [Shouchella shacheensis]
MAEGTVSLVVYLLAILLLGSFTPISVFYELFILLGIGLILAYVLLRYAISGMEFTAVATKEEYQKERKKIFKQSLIFVFIFAIVYSIVSRPLTGEDWVDVAGVTVLSGIFMFLLNDLSLRRSYHKNKGLLDERE